MMFVFLLLLVLFVTPAQADIVTGLQIHWKMDGGAGNTTIPDLSGNGRTGTFGTTTNAPTWLSGAGTNCQLANCISFDGGDAITFTGYNPGTTFTWAFWIYVGTNPAAEVVVMMQSGVDAIYYEGTGANVQKLVGGGSNVSTTIPLATWTHVAYVLTGTSYQWYFNGVAAGSGTGNAQNISWNTVGSPASGGFVGRLNDVWLFNRALSASDIGELITAGGPDITSNLQLSLQFNGGPAAGTLAVNTGLGAHNATLSAGVTWVAGREGPYAVHFNDNSSHLVTVSGTQVYATTGAPFTLALWTNLSAFTVTSFDYPAPLHLRSDGTLTFEVSYSNDSADSCIGINFGNNAGGFVRGRTALALEADMLGWHHLAIVYNGTGATTLTNYTLYFDGTSRTLTGTSCAAGKAQQTTIGGFATDTQAEDWQGDIDDVRVYSRGLTAADVAALITASVATTTRRSRAVLY